MVSPEKRDGTAGTKSSTTVLLLRSEHIAWGGVWEVLRGCPEIHLIEGGRSAAWTLDLAAQDPPLLIVAPVSAAWASMSPLLAVLHERFPAAKMALLGELPSAAGLRLLRNVDLCTYLGWDEVLPDSLWLLLRTALTRDLRIASTSLLRRYPLDLESRPPIIPVALDPLEREVLIWLACGLTKEKVAAKVAHSPRTVYRVTSTLRQRFGVATAFELGAVAERLGLLTAVQIGDAQQDLSHEGLPIDGPRQGAHNRAPPPRRAQGRSSRLMGYPAGISPADGRGRTIRPRSPARSVA